MADKAVNEVHKNSLKVLQCSETHFGYNSLNGQNMPVVSSVHFKKNLQNASRVGFDTDPNNPRNYNQKIYGDGGTCLFNFTSCVDVIAHEIMVSALLGSNDKT